MSAAVKVAKRLKEMLESKKRRNSQSKNRFNAAAEKVKSLTKKPTDQELLDLYALFKQGSLGDNDTSKPSFLDMKGKYKWEAWTKVKGKPKDEAKEEYIKFVETLFSKYS